MFEGIAGQEDARRTLCSMIESGLVPHTLLFNGPYGVGKGEAALELARLLLCEKGMNSGCSTCGACIRASRIEHPDLHVLFPYRAQPDNAKEYNKWLDGLIDHRKLLAKEPYAPVVYEKGRQIVKEFVIEVQEKLFETSFEGGRKVCVILAADKLNAKTANSLLKILEEPPGGVHFILTTERLSSILPTIISRASIVRFQRLKVEEIATYLENHGIADPSNSRKFAAAGEGSVKTAKAVSSQDKEDIRSRAFEIYTSVATGDYDDVISGVTPFARSRDILEAEELVKGFARCTRSVLEAKVGMKTFVGDYSETVKKLALSTDISLLHRLSTRIEEGLDMLGRNVNISMVLTTILYEINDIFRKEQLTQERHNNL